LLQGRKPGSLKAAAQRYGQGKEIEVLSHFSHADLLSLMVIETRHKGSFEADIELLPTRGNVSSVFQLYNVSYTAAMFSAVYTEIFPITVEIPGFLSDQLKHFKDSPLPGGV
jgi:hypothetical protein